MIMPGEIRGTHPTNTASAQDIINLIEGTPSSQRVNAPSIEAMLTNHSALIAVARHFHTNPETISHVLQLMSDDSASNSQET